MKKYIVFLLLSLLALSLAGCGGLNETATACLADLQAGLQERYDVTSSYSTLNEYKSKEIKGIDVELNAITAYKDVDLKNDGLNTIVSDYISALENQKEGINYIDSDNSKYKELYCDNGSEVRKECLKKLVDEYDFSVAEEYEDYFNDTLNITMIALDESVKATTENGEYEVKIVGAAETEWDKTGYEGALEDSDESTYPASIRLEAKNISYSGFLYDGKMSGYDLADDKSIIVTDGEGYSLEHYDTLGYSDGEYDGDAATSIGEKAKISSPYIVPNEESVVIVIINNTYKAIVGIDRENIVTIF